jgi:hypothetical protein
MQALLMRRAEQQMAQLEASLARQRHDYPLRVFLNRRAANSAQLWGACAEAACRRAHRCRRRHAQCLGQACKREYANRRALHALGKFDALLKIAQRERLL